MNAIYQFKLRRDIKMDGDLQLARREPNGYFSLLGDAQTLAEEHFPESQQFTRDGQQGYAAQGSLELLPTLIRRLSFIQTIYVIVEDSPQVQDILHQCSQTIHWREQDGHLLIEATPHYTFFEYADIAIRKTKNVADTRKTLSLLLDALLKRTDNPKAHNLLAQVQSATTTTPLCHGIHYYKAKFFPRMARAMLNLSQQRIGQETVRVLDPFVGSGTTLLESSTLGLASVGWDIDPLSVLISQTKLNFLQHSAQGFEDELARIFLISQANYYPNIPNISQIQFPKWLLKNRKMTDEVAQSLYEEIAQVQHLTQQVLPEFRDIWRVLLSDALSRRIKMRFLGTGVGRFSLNFSKTPLMTLFTRSLYRLSRTLSAWEWLEEALNLHLAPSIAQLGDARQASDNPFDVIVTSPPYLPASSGRESYAKARAPSLLALGMTTLDEVDSLSDTAVGSMDSSSIAWDELTPDVKKLIQWLEADTLRTLKAEPTARYFLEMRQSFMAMKQMLVQYGVAMVVIGRQSTYYDYQSREVLFCVPVAEWLAQEAEFAGLVVEEQVHIPLQKANRNARPRSLDDYDETILILRKP